MSCVGQSTRQAQRHKFYISRLLESINWANDSRKLGYLLSQIAAKLDDPCSPGAV